MKRYGLIGKTLIHSYSAQIHKEFGYSYDLVELPEHQLKTFVQSKERDGFNVTIPYKKSIIQHLDYVDATALAIDAVNTVKYIDGASYGYNTDIYGMDYALQSADIDLENKKVIILGSGGTASTAKTLATMKKAQEIVIVSRTGKTNYNNLHTHYDGQVIINTTPVGMYPSNGKSVVDIGKFEQLESVFDAIYNPLLTPLLFSAKKRGIRYAPGLKMLVAQAKFARDIFIGKALDMASVRAVDQEIERIYKKLFLDAVNIVLVGMPSSGKSTVGKELSKVMGKRFVDTDAEIEKASGKSIAEIFDKRGEPVFRELEREMIGKLGKENNQVIATGGGAVQGKDAYEKLKQNGIIIFLERDLAKTQTAGRPLLASQSKQTVEKLYRERLPLYTQFADITIDNNGTVQHTTKLIMESIYENFGD